MPSQLLNRINIDAGIDPAKIAAYYKEGQEKIDAQGWSSNEGRYQAFCRAYAYRKALEDGCKRLSNGDEGARNSRALQALIKSTLSEIEAEKQGIYL